MHGRRTSNHEYWEKRTVTVWDAKSVLVDAPNQGSRIIFLVPMLPLPLPCTLVTRVDGKMIFLRIWAS
jgi:hypothetical protein